MKKIILLVLLLIPISAHAEWTKQDTILEVAWQGVHLLDWGQTLNIAKNPNKYSEMNPILGKHPSIEKVNIYMGCSMVGHLLISIILPKEYRKYWQIGSIFVSTIVVTRNYGLGLKINF